MNRGNTVWSGETRVDHRSELGYRSGAGGRPSGYDGASLVNPPRIALLVRRRPPDPASRLVAGLEQVLERGDVVFHLHLQDPGQNRLGQFEKACCELLVGKEVDELCRGEDPSRAPFLPAQKWSLGEDSRFSSLRSAVCAVCGVTSYRLATLGVSTIG